LLVPVFGPHHPYPDGLLLITGTMFVPNLDRDTVGRGFVHRIGDRVRTSPPRLGMLVMRVDHADNIEPCSFGTTAPLHNLVAREHL
jgi:fumarylacetoacetate (FAA) hydrolase family protein